MTGRDWFLVDTGFDWFQTTGFDWFRLVSTDLVGSDW